MDFVITLDSQAADPLYQQLYAQIRQAILAARLKPGQRLPSTRELACSLKVARGTVKLSYEQLLSEGYLETIVGSGTFVCSQLPEKLLQSALSNYSQARHQKASFPVKLSHYGTSLAKLSLPRNNRIQPSVKFHHWRPAFEELPWKIWRQLMSRNSQLSPELLDYSNDWLGYKPLREAIADYLRRARAVQCNAEQIVIVSGSQQALDLTARLFVDRGDVVAIEEPGYSSIRNILLAYGAKLLPIGVDASGLIVEQLPPPSKTITKLLYITPSHQLPTGATLSLPRRLALLDWSVKTGTLIIEDDYDSEYRYEEKPIPSLQGLKQSDSVIYIGTFSKILFPALRIGYLVVPLQLVNFFATAKKLTDRQSSSIEQYALTDFINEGHLDRHIRRMRHLYAWRRQIMVNLLQSKMGDRISILGEKAGIHLMIKLQTDLSNEEVVFRANSVGIWLRDAKEFYLGSGGLGEFLIGYAEPKEAEIKEKISHLAEVLDS